MTPALLASDTLNREAAAFAHRLLQLAADTNVESDVFVLACADVIAITAASLDRFGQPMPLAERLESLTARIRETYTKQRMGRPTV